MAVNLTEDAIRERVGLEHENLEDVKALSLPGTIHEKVTHIGGALRRFTRIKELDLSRNSLVCLEGIMNLKLLEKLNLYYNNIGTLEELRRLQYNSNLKDIDLRLNPVSRNEPDYRLFLIHLLPALQRLDDRSVRDRERQAALIHFSSSQAAEFNPAPDPPPPTRQPLPRTKFIQKINKGKAVLDDDDVAVLDLIAQSGGDLSKPFPVTGSAAHDDNVEEYDLADKKQLDQVPFYKMANIEEIPESDAQQSIVDDDVQPDADMLPSQQEKYPNIAALTTEEAYRKGQAKKKERAVNGHDAVSEEVEAFSTYQTHGHFTPHPGSEDKENYEQRKTDSDEHRRRKIENQPDEDHPPLKPHHGKEDNVQNKSVSDSKEKEMLFKILDFVDRYWNGSKSLHRNPKFKSLAMGCLEKLTSSQPAEPQAPDQQLIIQQLKMENKKLRNREIAARENVDNISESEVQLRNSLFTAQKDVENLRSQLKKYSAANDQLKDKLQRQEASQSAVSMASVNQSQLDTLQKDNDALQQEVKIQQIRMRQYVQMQELAGMLQDSHKSLVQTNEHLLKELDETKQRHGNEVHQLHWSYDQLKNTMGYLPSASTNNISASPTLYEDES